MFFSFSLKSSLLLIFFVHGLVFGLLLLINGYRQESRQSIWLGLFAWLCSLYIAPFMLGYAGWYGRDGFREVLFYLPLQQLFLIGPVMYFYTRSLIDPDFVLSKMQRLHFLPAIGYLLYSLVVFVVDVFVAEEVYFYADGRDKDLDPWYQVAGLVSMTFYFGLSLKHYEDYKKLTYNFLSFAEAVVYRWMQRYLVAILVILFLRVLFFILNPEWGEFGSKFWYYLCFSILFYYISIAGYTHAVQRESPFWGISRKLSSVWLQAPVEESGPAKPDRDSGTTSQKVADLDIWKERVESYLDGQQAYADPGLTLLDVAGALETTPKQISQVVNQGFQMNFNDFVNHYRTNALIRKFEAGEHHAKTLLALAFECGFNSKSTFNRAFKKDTGMTPKDFLEKLT